VKWNDGLIFVYVNFITPPTPAPGKVRAVNPIAVSPYYVLRVKKTKDSYENFTFILIANGEETVRKRLFIP